MEDSQFLFGDMIWHGARRRRKYRHLTLPTHIGLFIGLIMSVTAPVWSAWADAKSGKDGLRSQLLLVFGVRAAWTVCLLMFRYANLWILYGLLFIQRHWIIVGILITMKPLVGLKSMYIQAALTTAVLAVFLQRWSPERGSMFVYFPSILYRGMIILHLIIPW